jgi:FkbM family methyltransferase
MQITSAARKLIGSSPAFNPALRTVWKLAAPVVGRRNESFPITGRFQVPLPGGGRIRFETESEDWEFTNLFWRGFEGEDAADILQWRNLCRSARTILDIGASIGIFSVIAALENPQANVQAFEPLPANLRVLPRMAERNRVTFKINDFALSDTSGSIDFFVPRDGMVHKRDASLESRFRSEWQDCDKITVQTRTLDELGLSNVDLIKLDVESAEYRVIGGGRKTLLAQRPVILCEVLYGTTEKQLQSAFAGLGYRFFWLGNEGPQEQRELKPDPQYKFKNYLLLPEERRFEIKNGAVNVGER